MDAKTGVLFIVRLLASKCPMDKSDMEEAVRIAGEKSPSAAFDAAQRYYMHRHGSDPNDGYSAFAKGTRWLAIFRQSEGQRAFELKVAELNCGGLTICPHCRLDCVAESVEPCAFCGQPGCQNCLATVIKEGERISFHVGCKKECPTYYFMVGIPGSGKSTYAASLGCRIVCPDTIGETHRVGSPEAFEIARQEIRSALKAGEDVVFDATNTLRVYRAEMINAGKPYAGKVVCIWLDIPLEVCIARHLERMKQGVRTTLPVSVIERMSNQLADNPPDLAEGFDEIRRLKMPGTVA